VTGTVEELITERRAGFIRAEDGSRVHFHASAVLGHQFDFLAAGQEVSFDLEARSQSAVRVQRELVLSRVARKTDGPMQLRYAGFDQASNIREYRFEGVAHGEATKHFVVTADLSLFVKFHVGMQEGPALCMRKLTLDLALPRRARHELTTDDLAAYVAARTAAVRKTSPRKWRNPRKPGAQPPSPLGHPITPVPQIP
jgi:cold shock CspA family protein